MIICVQISPEEEEKRRVRRERNKQAAAKCRNRRRELTDTLQAVSIPLDLLSFIKMQLMPELTAVLFNSQINSTSSISVSLPGNRSAGGREVQPAE